MKKYFLFACVAAALVSCTSDDFLGNEAGLTQRPGDGSILFQSSNMKAQRAAQTGAEAAATLGGNFIVEGVKGADADEFADMETVFDNYLVVWGANTAGTTDDNTDDWAYVNKSTSDHVTSINAIRGGSVDVQTIKYWDYSQAEYDFIAYSTGSLNMVTTTPTAGTSIKVTKINKAAHATAAYEFTAKSADDFAQIYYTDIEEVTKASNSYGQPVTLTFKNMSAKVRVGLYETIPGYSVKDVKFYQDKATTIATGASSANAALYTTGTDVIAGSGTITVSYPKTGNVGVGDADYNKAHLDITGADDDDQTTMALGAITGNYTTAEDNETAGSLYLGRSLSAATMAGASAKDYFTYVMPTTDPVALTLRVDYTLVSTDGSGEEINVYGAQAVVPPTYTEWQSNYAYTYIFKISDNTNGWTSQVDSDPQGLFPITFDAVVADITDASTADQTTVTTVATPSITSYQKDHEMGNEYAAGDIYVQVMNSGLVDDLDAGTNAWLYTVANGVTEADVASALQLTASTTSTTITGRNGVVLTKTAADALDTTVDEIPGADGNAISITAGEAAMFTAAAGNYAFVYKYDTETPKTIYTAVEFAASAAKPGDFLTKYFKTHTGTAVTDADWDNSDAQVFYQKWTTDGNLYAVKVIHVE